MARAEGILHELDYHGYVEFWPGYKQAYGIAHPYLRSHEISTFGQVFAVDLHTGPLSLSFFDRRMTPDALFERAQALLVAGAEASGLCAEDHPIHSCGHLALHHRYDEALSRYYETAAVVQRTGADFDWDAVAERAAAWRLTLPVQLVLARMERLWPGFIPADVLNSIARLQPTLTERYMHDWLVTHRKGRALLLDGLFLPGLGNRARFLLETVVPSPAFMRDRHGPGPGGYWPLLYFRRAVGWLRFLP